MLIVNVTIFNTLLIFSISQVKKNIIFVENKFYHGKIHRVIKT